MKKDKQEMQKNKRESSSGGQVMKGFEVGVLKVELDHLILAPVLYTVPQWGFPHQHLREEATVYLFTVASCCLARC